MNTTVVSAAMIDSNSTVIKEAFQRNWLSPFVSPDSSPFRVLVTSYNVSSLWFSIACLLHPGNSLYR